MSEAAPTPKNLATMILGAVILVFLGVVQLLSVLVGFVLALAVAHLVSVGHGDPESWRATLLTYTYIVYLMAGGVSLMWVADLAEERVLACLLPRRRP